MCWESGTWTKKVVVKNVIKTARTAGLKADIPYNLTIALGTIAVSPFELAQAYIPFSNGGFRVEPIFIKRIEDNYGEVMYESQIKKERVHKVLQGAQGRNRRPWEH